MEPEGSLPRLQDPAACTYPEQYTSYYHQLQHSQQQAQLEGMYERILVSYY
jgi:hypothetical protein